MKFKNIIKEKLSAFGQDNFSKVKSLDYIDKKLGRGSKKCNRRLTYVYYPKLSQTYPLTKFKKKKKKGSNGMEPNRLILNNYYRKDKYLNVSLGNFSCCVGVAEWSMQSIDTRYPSGCVGSIPTPDAVFIFINLEINKNKISKSFDSVNTKFISIMYEEEDVSGCEREIKKLNIRLINISSPKLLQTLTLINKTNIKSELVRFNFI
jgi:hypothetical protein